MIWFRKNSGRTCFNHNSFDVDWTNHTGLSRRTTEASPPAHETPQPAASCSPCPCPPVPLWLPLLSSACSPLRVLATSARMEGSAWEAVCHWEKRRRGRQVLPWAFPCSAHKTGWADACVGWRHFARRQGESERRSERQTAFTGDFTLDCLICWPNPWGL